MYTRGEFDDNLRRIMGQDSRLAVQNINYIAKYMELHIQLEFMDRLIKYPDLYDEKDYKRDLKLLAERANFKFNEEST